MADQWIHADRPVEMMRRQRRRRRGLCRGLDHLRRRDAGDHRGGLGVRDLTAVARDDHITPARPQMRGRSERCMSIV